MVVIPRRKAGRLEMSRLIGWAWDRHCVMRVCEASEMLGC